MSIQIKPVHWVQFWKDELIQTLEPENEKIHRMFNDHQESMTLEHALASVGMLAKEESDCVDFQKIKAWFNSLNRTDMLCAIDSAYNKPEDNENKFILHLYNINRINVHYLFGSQ